MHNKIPNYEGLTKRTIFLDLKFFAARISPIKF